MKRIIAAFATLVCISSVFITGFTVNGDSTMKNNNSPIVTDASVVRNSYKDDSGGTEKQYMNINELFEYWEQNGYPDYVGSVFSTDGSMNNLTVLLVNDDGDKANQIRSLLADDSGVSFGMAAYSHNVLKVVNDEIIANYLGKDEKVYSVSVGWISVDGIMSGFGESGKESRVVVSVDKSVLSKYMDEFYKLYGDMVVVEQGQAIVYQTELSNINLRPLMLLILVIILAVTGILFLNQTHHVPVLQTMKGTVITQTVPLNRKETIAIIKNSETTPSDEVFRSISCEIDNKEG